MDKVSTRPFRTEDASAFRDLNLAWIEAYFAVEALDRKLLEQPQAEIIDSAGAIEVAELEGVVVGVVALLYLSPGYYELAKMAVREDLHGHGIGHILMDSVLQRARKMKARKLLIVSNSKLVGALHLYRKFGFNEIAVPQSKEYARADVMMELYID
ncbi:MAG: GNAT family N-acetyltransferase [Verrucomicrobiota bacterium]